MIDGGGATGVSSKIPEYKTAWSISKKLEAILEKRGYKVVMTKANEGDGPTNRERAEIGNKNKADLVIRIHCDSNSNPSANGGSVLYPTNAVGKDLQSKCKTYAEKILDEYIAVVGLNKRNAYEKDLIGFNWSTVPVVLIETGFISNIKDDQYLSDKENHEKIATGIANGIDACFK